MIDKEIDKNVLLGKEIIKAYFEEADKRKEKIKKKTRTENTIIIILYSIVGLAMLYMMKLLSDAFIY